MCCGCPSVYACIFVGIYVYDCMCMYVCACMCVYPCVCVCVCGHAFYYYLSFELFIPYSITGHSVQYLYLILKLVALAVAITLLYASEVSMKNPSCHCTT